LLLASAGGKVTPSAGAGLVLGGLAVVKGYKPVVNQEPLRFGKQVIYVRCSYELLAYVNREAARRGVSQNQLMCDELQKLVTAWEARAELGVGEPIAAVACS
jgi:hypothetical protein